MRKLAILSLFASLLFFSCNPNSAISPPDFNNDVTLNPYGPPPEIIPCEIILPDNVALNANYKNNFHKAGKTFEFSFRGGSEHQREFVKTYGSEFVTRDMGNVKMKFYTEGAERPGTYIIGFARGRAYSCLGLFCDGWDGQGSPHMNFGWINPETVRHEFMHFFNFLHDHQICCHYDWDKPFVYNLTQGWGWDKGTTDFNILNYHDESIIDTEPYNPESLMSYNITKGMDLNGKTSNSSKDFLPSHFRKFKEAYPHDDEPGPVIVTPVTDCKDCKEKLIVTEGRLEAALSDLGKKNEAFKEIKTILIDYRNTGEKTADAQPMIESLYRECGLN